MPRRVFKRIRLSGSSDSPPVKRGSRDDDEVANSNPDIFSKQLPTEMWREIIKNLDGRSRRRLRMTNCRLRNVVPFNSQLLSNADVYITEKCVVTSFKQEGHCEKFQSGHNAFSQTEMKKISHSLRKLNVKTVWIDIHPMRISFPKLRNLLRLMARIFAASLSSDALITITHASTLNLPINVYDFLWKRISGKNRRIVFPFVQYTNSYRRLINSACQYNWNYFGIRYHVVGSTVALMNWITPDFHLIKPGKIDHICIVQPRRINGRRYIADLITILRTGDYKFGMFEFVIDMADDSIDIVQPIPRAVKDSSSCLQSFPAVEFNRNPVLPKVWRACTILFNNRCLARISPVFPLLPFVDVRKMFNRPEYITTAVFKSCKRIVLFLDTSSNQ